MGNNTLETKKEIIIRCQGKTKEGQCNKRLFDILTNHEPLKEMMPIEVVCNRDHYPYQNGKRYKAVNVISCKDSKLDVKVYYREKIDNYGKSQKDTKRATVYSSMD